MRKLNHYRMLLISGVCLFGLSSPITASAQCVTPPTCSELGYTKTASECSGHTFLKCPFNTTVGYCDLGTGTTPIPDPTPSYKVGDAYAINKVVIGKIIDITNDNVLIVAYTPKFSTASINKATAQQYCDNLTVGDNTWFLPQKRYCQTIVEKFTLIKNNWYYLTMGNGFSDTSACHFDDSDAATLPDGIYQVCVAQFLP